MSLKQQVVKGVSWNIFEQIARQCISIGITVVLARILSPKDYGLVALSAVFTGFIWLFGNLAMGSAIIQRKEINDDYLSTSFWTSVASAVVLYLVLCAIAPFTADYYNQPLLKSIIMVSGIGLLISPLYVIHKSLLTKDLAFGKLAIMQTVNAMVSSGASLIIALLGFGVWSLVLGSLVSGILYVPALWYMVKWRPKAVFKRDCFRDLFGFSSYLLAFNTFNYFARNFDNLIIGKFLGAGVLGIYSIAYEWMMKPLKQISWSLTRVMFPAFSTIQDDLVRVRSAVLKMVSVISFITFPMMTGLLMVAPELILVVLGPKWEGVIVPLQLLCLIGALQSIGTIVGSIFNSQGRSDLQFKTGVVTSIGHVVGFLIGIRWGLTGLIKAYICTNLIFFFYNQHYVNRLIGLDMPTFLKPMRMPALNSLIMGLLLLAYRYLNDSLLHMNQILFLVSSVCLGVLSYIASNLIFLGKEEFGEYKDMIYQRLKLKSAATSN